jgi:hypothetical protein
MTARTYVWLMRRALVVLAGLVNLGLRTPTVIPSLVPQPLSHVLSAMPALEGVHVLASEAPVSHLEASAMSGALTVRDAFDGMLQGAALGALQQDEKTYVIRECVLAPHSTGEMNVANDAFVVRTPDAVASADGPALHLRLDALGEYHKISLAIFWT